MKRLVGLLAAAVAFAVPASALAAIGHSSNVTPVLGITGAGDDGGLVGWQPTVTAQILSDGTVQGYLTLCVPNCASGSVFQVVPPSATQDWWCIAAIRDDVDQSTFHNRVNSVTLYVHDVGDGVTTFDGWGAISSFGDCSVFPAYWSADPSFAVGVWAQLDAGDFHSMTRPALAKPALKAAYAKAKAQAVKAKAKHGKQRGSSLGAQPNLQQPSPVRILAQ